MGESPHSDIIKLHMGPHCCIGAGGCKKIADNRNIVSGPSYKESLDSTQEMMSAASDALTKKSARAILEAESG